MRSAIGHVVNDVFWMVERETEVEAFHREDAAVAPWERGLAARFQQGQVALTVHRDIAVLPQLFHGNAHACLGIAQLIDHVDGTDTAHSLVEHQDRFKIIFCGLVDLHGIGLLPS